MDERDPQRFETHFASPRGFAQAYVHENPGGAGPLLLVHGWPETKRIWWRVIEPLASAGFEVIAPDLRGFGESDVGPDGFHDVPSHAATCTRSCTTTSATTAPCSSAATSAARSSRTSRCGSRLRRPHGAVQLAAAVRQGAHGRHALRDRHAKPATTSSARAPTPTGSRPSSPRRSSAAATSRPSTRRGSGPTPARSDDDLAPAGRFGGSPTVDFHTEPFADGAKLRASFGGYESVFNERRPQRAADDGSQRGGRDAHPVRPERPRALPRLRPHGRGQRSRTTSARSCSATAATSCRGRRRDPRRRASGRSAATCCRNRVDSWPR